MFNDALNTFYLRLYGIGHIGKAYSDSERGRKEGNVLFNDALNTFYLWKEGNVSFNGALNTFYLQKEGRKEMFHLTMHSAHFIYG